MKQYKTILTEKGKRIFKGGNIEPMSEMLITFEAENQKKAEQIYYNKLIETLGGSMELHYKVVEVNTK